MPDIVAVKQAAFQARPAPEKLQACIPFEFHIFHAERVDAGFQRNFSQIFLRRAGAVVFNHSYTVNLESCRIVVAHEKFISTIRRNFEVPGYDGADMVLLTAGQNFARRGGKTEVGYRVGFYSALLREIRQILPGSIEIFNGNSRALFVLQFVRPRLWRGDKRIGAKEEFLIIVETVTVGVVGCQRRSCSEITFFPFKISFLFFRKVRQNLQCRTVTGHRSIGADCGNGVGIGSVFGYYARNSCEGLGGGGADESIALKWSRVKPAGAAQSQERFNASGSFSAVRL